MIRRPPRSTLDRSSAASDVYKRQILVIAPVELLASKVIAYAQRRSSPKAGTDWRDIALLLLTFPSFKRDPGPVTDRLLAGLADETVLAAWRELVAQPLVAGHEDDEF